MKCLALNRIPVVFAILVVICLICVFHVKLESIYIRKNLVDSTCFISVSFIFTIMLSILFLLVLKIISCVFFIFSESLFACSHRLTFLSSLLSVSHPPKEEPKAMYKEFRLVKGSCYVGDQQS